MTHPARETGIPRRPEMPSFHYVSDKTEGPDKPIPTVAEWRPDGEGGGHWLLPGRAERFTPEDVVNKRIVWLLEAPDLIQAMKTDGTRNRAICSAASIATVVNAVSPAGSVAETIMEYADQVEAAVSSIWGTTVELCPPPVRTPAHRAAVRNTLVSAAKEMHGDGLLGSATAHVLVRLLANLRKPETAQYRRDLAEARRHVEAQMTARLEELEAEEAAEAEGSA